MWTELFVSAKLCTHIDDTLLMLLCEFEEDVDTWDEECVQKSRLKENCRIS
jgi:hypothetical protein